MLKAAFFPLSPPRLNSIRIFRKNDKCYNDNSNQHTPYHNSPPSIKWNEIEGIARTKNPDRPRNKNHNQKVTCSHG